MIIPTPQDFAPHIHAVASQKMLDDGVVHPMLFLGAMGKPMMIFSVSGLMTNDASKDVLSLLPAYLGVLMGGIDFVAFISESWIANMPAIVDEFGKERASDREFIRSLSAQYGGPSGFPEKLRSEVVTVSIDVVDETYWATWSTIRDEAGKPSVATYDTCVIDKINGYGRLIGFLGRYHKLKRAFDEISVALKKETGETLTLQFLAETLSKIESTDAHQKACSLASSIFTSMASLPADPLSSTAAPTSVQ